MTTRRSGRWALAARLAARDFSWRFKGLRLLLVCLFIGAGVLAAIGTLEGAVRGELQSRGREILGGDIEVELYARELSDVERAALSALGQVSAGARLQAMARTGDEADIRTAPVQLKSVDGRWPLYGAMVLQDGRRVAAPPEGSAWAGQDALDRLGVAVGDTIRLGETQVRIGGIIASEPDRLSEGFALGPPVIVSNATLAATGLVQPGSMARYKYRVALPAETSPDAALESLGARFADSGWDTRTRDRASPGADRLVGRMGQFLSLIGLSALVIAGIGIGGAVSSWLEARRGSLTTLKVLGADSGDVVRIHALQVLAASAIGVGAGLIAGVLAVPLLAQALAGLIPVGGGLRVDLPALLRAAAFALLVALVFATPPLLATRRVAAMALLRAQLSSPQTARPRASALLADWAPVAVGLAAIAALAFATADDPRLTAWFLGGAAAVLALLALAGRAVRRLAGRLPRRRALSRLAVAALSRPGAPTVSLVTALGFGLSAFVAIAAIQTSLSAYIERAVPERAPDYFVIDLPRSSEEAFTQLVTEHAPGAEVRAVPALRGAILAFGPEGAMTRTADLEEIPEGAWALRGERGLTYASALPEGNTVTAGSWWAEDHAGEPLVSIDEELARSLDLEIGDMLAIGLLGVERQARIASFRRIEWDSFGLNNALVFSPGAIDDAPHNLTASVMLPPGVDRPALLRAMVDRFPASAVIEVGSILGDVRALISQIGTAILSASAVAVLAGMAVLLGAIAAARARETYDTIVLRVLGASRAQLLGALALRYAMLAAMLALVALALGGVTAWYVVTGLFDFAFEPDWTVVTAVLIGGAGLVTAAAVAASLPVLGARPAAALRTL